jgi:hypothetical protein
MSGQDWGDFEEEEYAPQNGWGEFEDEEGNIIEATQDENVEEVSNDEWGHGIRGLGDNATRRMRRPITIPVPEPLEEEEYLEEEYLEEDNFEPLSPKTRRLLEIEQMSPISRENARRRFVIEEQDREYEKALAEDIRNEEERLRLKEELRLDALRLEEELRIQFEERLRFEEHEKLRLMRIEEELQLIKNMQPPIYSYDIANFNTNDLIILRFTLPTKKQINHTFHKDEPLLTLINQIKYDLRYLYGLILNIAGRQVISCDYNYTISQCGIPNRSTIYVSYELVNE